MRKPFDIEKAKNGAKVVTRDDRLVEILKYDYKDDNYPIIAMITNNDGRVVLGYFTTDGCCYSNKCESCFDFFIEEEPQYRPYISASEMDADIIKHGCIVMVKNSKDRRIIRCYHEGYVELGGIKATQTYECLFKMYTWLDGTPCGILE